TPVVLMRSTCRCGFFKRRPTSFAFRLSDSGPISQPTETDVQLLSTKTSWSYLSKVLQFKQHFTISSFTKSMNNGFPFFVVLRQCPRRDRLIVTSSKARTTIGVKNAIT